MKSFSLRTLFSVFGFVGLGVLAGCSGAESVDSGNAIATKTAVTAEQADGNKGPRGPHAGRPHGGGPDFLVFAALHENINLTADQRGAIEGLISKDRPMARPAPDKAKTAALAASVRAGKVEATALQVNREGGDAIMKDRAAASATKLASLHKTLTKEQRAALVDAIVAKHSQRPDGPPHSGRPEGAHEGGREGGPMGHLLEGLDLTQAQKDAIKSKLEAQRPAAPSEADRVAMKAKFESMKKDMDAKLQTFKADTFDATAFVSPPANGPKPPEGHADRMAKDLSIVVSVLDAAQREKLAQRIEQGPPARH